MLGDVIDLPRWRGLPRLAGPFPRQLSKEKEVTGIIADNQLLFINQ